MIDQTLQKIEKRLQQASSMRGENREELLKLVRTLKEEVTQLSQTHGNEAENITRSTDDLSHEATREGRDQESFESSLQRLSESVEGLETSHPKLVQLVNRMATILSNLGV